MLGDSSLWMIRKFTASKVQNEKQIAVYICFCGTLQNFYKQLKPN
ncbi:hypothetical protein bcere0029_40290 [Bacillus cereus AH1272]|nr:hypothetical protein bcere0029_40290 [Bacillus cereus AH1272]EEL91985.1 hypothetical protein bcere0030_39990 [Bacillus cereus AH1273]